MSIYIWQLFIFLLIYALTSASTLSGLPSFAVKLSKTIDIHPWGINGVCEEREYSHVWYALHASDDTALQGVFLTSQAELSRAIEESKVDRRIRANIAYRYAMNASCVSTGNIINVCYIGEPNGEEIYAVKGPPCILVDNTGSAKNATVTLSYSFFNYTANSGTTSMHSHHNMYSQLTFVVIITYLVSIITG
jgi:hypothetical protein